MSLLSVIVPCYNEEENVDCFYEELMKNTPFFEKEGLELEILYVDDGSKDRTVEEVKDLRKRDERVHLISFSRNFGKESAIYAGLESEGRLCGYDGCGSAGSAVPASGNVFIYKRRL